MIVTISVVNKVSASLSDWMAKKTFSKKFFLKFDFAPSES